MNNDTQPCEEMFPSAQVERMQLIPSVFSVYILLSKLPRAAKPTPPTLLTEISSSFNWVPFGNTTYYFFIGVKSSILSDLKYDQRKAPDRRLF